MAYTVTIVETSGTVQVQMDYGYGRQLAYSVPTGIGAAYPKAREDNRVECDRKITAFVDGLRSRYPDLIVVHA